MLQKQENKYIKGLFKEIWNAELIVSGIIIYGLFLINSESDYFADKIGSITGNISLVAFFKLLVGVFFVLLFNFIIHLLLRAYWIGVIGLNSTYQEGIKFEKLNYTDSYIKKNKKKYNSLETYSAKLDDLCSQLFSFSFLVFLICTSFLIIAIIPITILQLFDSELNIIRFIYYLYFVLSGIFFIDLFTGGFFRKFKYLYFVYRPIYSFYSLISLEFIYRPIYLTFISNTSKLKLTSLLISFFIFSIFGGTYIRDLGSSKYLNDLKFYNYDFSDEDRSLISSSYSYRNISNIGAAFSIDKDVYENDDFLKLFIKFGSTYYFANLKEISELNKTNKSIQRDSAFLELIVKSQKLKIDNDYLLEDSLVFNQFYIDYNTNTKGIMSLVNLNSLSKGHHTLELEFSKKVRETSPDIKSKKIHFWIK